MRTWCAWIGSVVALLACAGADGALVPVSRNSEVTVHAIVGAQSDGDARQMMEFGTFDEAISAGAEIAGQGTASASATQRSSIDVAIELSTWRYHGGEALGFRH